MLLTSELREVIKMKNIAKYIRSDDDKQGKLCIYMLCNIY